MADRIDERFSLPLDVLHSSTIIEIQAKEIQVEGGLEASVTGGGRTLTPIQRMVPAHAQQINGLNGWTAKTESLPNGVRLTVTTADPKEVTHIRGLGFTGILVSGSDHLPHHPAIAKGEFFHAH